ncbi:ankyrin repeat-containing domain protein [Sphaerosporella brunnea]|uniref:Ankyrin repeat-containing domain protein n=1 Tax=Sphaerosporella brunnea TaxID=1250544 RepID=A0A5J5F833_9PEZI|nr:ankyrin repeat-containing domain protein [Sphaerosporella brunnea]
MASTGDNHDDGASPSELLIEAARRNNTDLLSEVLLKNSTAEFLNNTRDALGNTALHVAAQYGSYDVLDVLLDQEGLEVDPVNKIEGDTPLHKAVFLAREHKELGLEVAELLLDAGADPRVRNKQKMKPLDVTDPRDTKLRKALVNGEYTITAGNDLVDADDLENDAGSGGESE